MAILRRREIPLEKNNQPEKEAKLTMLRRRPWWEFPEYQHYPLKIEKWEDEGGVERTFFYVKCLKYERLISLDICIKGIFYFDPKDRNCKKCWKLPPKKDYPPPFLEGGKENKVPEALQILTERKTKRLKMRKEEENYVQQNS